MMSTSKFPNKIFIIFYILISVLVLFLPIAFFLPFRFLCVLCCPVCRSFVFCVALFVCVFLFASFVCFSCCLGLSEGKNRNAKKQPKAIRSTERNTSNYFEKVLNGVFMKNNKLKKSQNRWQKFIHFSCWHNLKSFDCRWLSDMSYVSNFLTFPSQLFF